MSKIILDKIRLLKNEKKNDCNSSININPNNITYDKYKPKSKMRNNNHLFRNNNNKSFIFSYSKHLSPPIKHIPQTLPPIIPGKTSKRIVSSYKIKKIKDNQVNNIKSNLPQITNVTNINISLYSNEIKNNIENNAKNNTINTAHVNEENILNKPKIKNKATDFYLPNQNFLSSIKNYITIENPLYSIKTADTKNTKSLDKYINILASKQNTKKTKARLHNTNSSDNLIPFPLLSNINSPIDNNNIQKKQFASIGSLGTRLHASKRKRAVTGLKH